MALPDKKQYSSACIFSATNESIGAPALNKVLFLRRSKRDGEVRLLALARAPWEMGWAVLPLYPARFIKRQIDQFPIRPFRVPHTLIPDI